MSFGYEYNTSNYGAGYGGGFDPMGGNDIFGEGGGFMNASTSSPEKKSKDKNSVIPLTCKQFNDASMENGSFFVDDKELHVVKLVGYVEQMDDHTTNTEYRINDGTGSVDCKFWTAKDKAAKASHSHIVVGTYVKVFGNPNEYEGRKNLVVYDIRELTDFNEVTYHILDAQLTSLQNTKGPLKKTTVQPASIGSPVRGISSYNPNTSASYRQQVTPSAQMGNMSINQPADLGTVKLVVDAIRSAQRTDIGFNSRLLPVFLAQRGVQVPEEKIRKILKSLSDEGNIYYTVDGEYVRLTDDNWTL